MQKLTITGTAIVGLLFGIAVPAYAWRDQEGQKQDGPQRQEDRRGQPREGLQRPPDHQQRQSRTKAERHDRAQQQRPTDRPPQQSQEVGRRHQNQQPTQARRQSDRNRQPSQHPSQQGRNEHPQRAQRQHVERSGWQQHRAHRWESEHRTWEQRGGYRGYRIPDDRFRGYFGPEHGFRIHGLPFLVVGGYPRFQYSGYWVSALDPWPEYWGDNWYDNDDVYVAYVDHGYYLFNRRYPRSGIAISISL